MNTQRIAPLVLLITLIAWGRCGGSGGDIIELPVQMDEDLARL